MSRLNARPKGNAGEKIFGTFNYLKVVSFRGDYDCKDKMVCRKKYGQEFGKCEKVEVELSSYHLENESFEYLTG